mmetsp:Transcript_73338/g.161965  ORF Transcript_73338/g.161965 Transcript_73338/m.161965 type:complete len:244 (+) Transcript_73338:157-888(+)
MLCSRAACGKCSFSSNKLAWSPAPSRTTSCSCAFSSDTNKLRSFKEVPPGTLNRTCSQPFVSWDAFATRCRCPDLSASNCTLAREGLLSDSDGASGASRLLSTTKTAVMLSPPKPPVSRRSGETQASRRSSRTCSKALSSEREGNRWRMKSTTCWLVFTSQTPSQQMIRNSSFSWSLSLKVTSGVEQIICSSGGLEVSFLYSRSPKARDKLRLPLTRYWFGPLFSTHPPAASIRCFSLGALGL